MSLAAQPIYNALIRRSMDLQRLCKRAAQQVVEPGLRVVLQENAATLELLILDLQMQLIAIGGQPATRGRWSSALRRRVGAWWLRTSAVSDQQWIHTLARRESVLLLALEHAIERAPPENALALRRLLPRLATVHLEMHSLASAAQ